MINISYNRSYKPIMFKTSNKHYTLYSIISSPFHKINLYILPKILHIATSEKKSEY